MNNNTRDDYKKAIRAKYEIEKEGEFSNYFLPTSQANLRNLCWLRFETNSSKDDTNIFFSFFDFEFDLSKSRHFSTNMTDKFRPVVTFLKGEKEPAKFSTVELAAILVDFHPRPFKKFNKGGCIEIDNPVAKPHETVKTPYMPEVIFVKNGDNEQFERNNEVEEKRSIQEEKLNEEADLSKTAFPNEQRNLRIEEILVDNETPKKEDILEEKIKAQNFKSEKFKEKNRDTGKRNMWIRAGAVSFLVFLVCYYFAQKKECMQWTGDYYEKVDCIQEINSLDIKPYDKIQFGLKKINVSETTSFFTVGKPCVWYGKSVNGNYECFNIPGLHPETGKTLRPITQYIVDRYLLENRE